MPPQGLRTRGHKSYHTMSSSGKHFAWKRWYNLRFCNQVLMTRACWEFSSTVKEGASQVPLLYLRKMAMVRGQILFSALVVNAGSTVQTMHSVSMTSVSTSELNWAASWTSPSRMLGRKGWMTCVLSDSFSWSQYLETWTRSILNIFITL